MCEQSLVGLAGCDVTPPKTGIYIDQTGITEGFISQLITGQYNTSYELFADKLSLAWKRIKTESISAMQPFIKADTITEGKRVGQVLTNGTNRTAALGAGTYVGVRLKIDNLESFIKLLVTDLQIYIDSANTNVPVLVIDLITNEVLATLTYTEGGAIDYISQEYSANRRKLDIAIVYESTVDAIKTVPRSGSCTDCGGNIKYLHFCPFVDGIGVKLDYDGSNISNVTNISNTGGVTINYGVECDRDAYMCSIGAFMATSLMYATAVEIYDYALTMSPTERVNTTVTWSVDEIREARNLLARKYLDELNITMKGLRLPNDRYCFRCKDNYRFVTMLP